MFKKTLRTLTLLNSVILILIIGLLGLTIYFYTQSVLNRNMDKTLHESVALMERPHGPAFRDPRLSIVLWDMDKHFIGTTRGFVLDKIINKDALNKMKPGKLNHITEKKIDDFYIRYIPIKVQTPNGPAIAEVVLIINSEIKMLHTLLLIILGGWVLGSLLAIVAGYYLARRALTPIQRSWERQTQFVSDASHELRTPLTIIQSRIEMLLQSPQSSIEEKIRDISVTLKETRRLKKLVSHLLTLAGTDSDRVEIEKIPVAMNELLGQVVEHFIEIAEFQEKTLSLEVPGNEVSILGDKERLHQLIVILLDNATKFTQEGSVIKVSLNVEHQWAKLKVIDDGIGIKEEHISKIFDRFFQADQSRTHLEGNGLGLSIANWIVDKHKGKIMVESQYEKGTTFVVMLPLYRQN